MAGKRKIPLKSGAPLAAQLKAALDAGADERELAVGIEELMDAHNYSRALVAEVLGISPPTVSRILDLARPEFAEALVAVGGLSSALQEFKALSSTTQAAVIREFAQSGIVYTGWQLRKLRAAKSAGVDVDVSNVRGFATKRSKTTGRRSKAVREQQEQEISKTAKRMFSLVVATPGAEISALEPTSEFSITLKFSEADLRKLLKQLGKNYVGRTSQLESDVITALQEIIAREQ